jgi:hypothetical protein
MAWRLSSSGQSYQFALYYQLLSHRSGAGTLLKAVGARTTYVRWLQQTQSLRHVRPANLARIAFPLHHNLAQARFTVMPTSTAIVSAPRPLQISALLTYRIRQARALSTRQSVTTRWGRRLTKPRSLCWAVVQQADDLHHHSHLQLNVSLTLACHQVPQVAPQLTHQRYMGRKRFSVVHRLLRRNVGNLRRCLYVLWARRIVAQKLLQLRRQHRHRW